MSKCLRITSAHDVTTNDRFHRHVTSPHLNWFSFYVELFVLLGSDGEFNQESKQFINPKEGACTTLTERTWF